MPAAIRKQVLDRVMLDAMATVALYRDEFPGEPPCWESEWWVEAWANAATVIDFNGFLDACRTAWGA